MTLREFLHIEIWSKQTSRRICITFGVVAFVFITLYTSDRFIVSPMERKAGKNALARIESARSLLTGSDEAFSVVDRKAEEEVKAAEQASLTSRDASIAAILGGYLMLVETEKSDQRFRLKMSNSSNPRFRQLRVADPKVVQLNYQVLDLLNQALHRALD